VGCENRANPASGAGFDFRATAIFLSPGADDCFSDDHPHGLRRGLHSFAASRLAPSSALSARSRLSTSWQRSAHGRIAIDGTNGTRDGGLGDFYFLIQKALIGFVGTGEFERVRNDGVSLLDAGDDVRAAEPMRFGQIRGRELGRMVRMGMVEANDVFSTVAAFALNAYQLAGINVVAVVSGVGACVAATGRAGDDAGAVFIESTEEDSAAFVGVGFFAVAADGVLVSAAEFQHRPGLRSEVSGLRSSNGSQNPQPLAKNARRCGAPAERL